MQANTIINNRYHLLKKLGEGGMGVVYQALDKLTGQSIALKQVTISGKSLRFASQASQSLIVNNNDSSYRLALAQEFKILASLRHPHIISVLDYGFDENRLPFFTMTLLESAQALPQASQGQSLPQKITYLTQTLQALAYLHRRGILHRDLKPGNVLVANNQAYVLDFGLSAEKTVASGTTGTLAYMAPEVLRTKQASPASDLYALGVLAYECLSGHHPFDIDSPRLVMDILQTEPDLTPLPPVLAPVIGKLLHKNPADRYHQVEAVLKDLYAALNQAPPPEQHKIRQSFLQAAQFVGRETELEQLQNALAQAQAGQGSFWLIGGESGVGKSRLLDEVRTHALVQGATVLRGQAVEEGGQAYQIWPELLRRLAFLSPLTDLQAGVIKPLVPDLETLLNRSIPPAAALDGEAAQQRLHLSIAQICRQTAQAKPPFVLLVEDLHWAEESLEPLKALARQVHHQPILIIGTYRNEERPHLPADLPSAQVLALPRLSTTHIATLSKAMLGEIGQRPDIVALLEKETEGNTFFLVETVNALAEDVGRLAAIGQNPLPETVFAGGVQALIQRRLKRVPQHYYPLLKLAALIGRAVDARLLQQLQTNINITAWLTACAEVAVLDVQDGQWRFAHDKLRAELQASLKQTDGPKLHRQVAQAYEAVYPNDDRYWGALSDHWLAGGNETKAGNYAAQAGEVALNQYAHQEALRFFNRAINLSLETDKTGRYQLLLQREKTCNLQGWREQQLADLETLDSLAQSLNQPHRQAEVALRHSTYAQALSNWPQAKQFAENGVHFAQLAANIELEAKAYLGWGRAAIRQGEFDISRQYHYQALDLSKKANLSVLQAEVLLALSRAFYYQDQLNQAKTLGQQALTLLEPGQNIQLETNILLVLAAISNGTGDFSTGIASNKQGLTLYQQIGDRQGEMMAQLNIGYTLTEMGQYHQASSHYKQALNLAKEIGSVYEEGLILHMWGILYGRLGQFAKAQDYYKQALYILTKQGSQVDQAEVLANLSLISYHQQDYQQAQAYARQSLTIAQKLKDTYVEGLAQCNLGHIWAEIGPKAKAIKAYKQACNLHADTLYFAVSAWAGLARLALAENNLAQAQEYIDPVWPWLEKKEPSGYDAFRVYLTCYHVLQATGDKRAQQVLQTAYECLNTLAEQLPKNEAQIFLENIPWHRQIKAEWSKQKL